MTYTNRNLRTGETSSGSLGTYSVFKDKEITGSVRTANFRNLRPALRPLNHYSHFKGTLTDPRSSFKTFSQAPGGDVIEWVYSMNAQAFGCDPTVPPGWAAENPYHMVLNKILSELNQGRSNLMVTMAEMDKTAAHLAHTAERLFKVVKALKSARYDDFTKALGLTTTRRQKQRFVTGLKKAVSRDGVSDQKFKYKKSFAIKRTREESHVSDFLSDTWLEYSYGWKPMLQDAYGIAEATASVFNEYSNVVRTATGRSKTSYRNHAKDRPSGNQVIYEAQVHDEIWMKMEVRYRIPTEHMNPGVAFGLMNPLEVAWELVPFSFVADWFLPVGDAIRGLTAYNGLEFAGGWYSYRHARTFTNKVYGAGESIIGGVRWFGQSGGAEVTNVEYDQARVLLSEFPYYGFPEFKDPRSFAHAASAIALLQSLFLRG